MEKKNSVDPSGLHWSQVGKTYTILEFGRTHYDNVAYFNF